MRADDGYYCIWIVNNGLGPAMVEDFVVKVDDVKIAAAPLEAVCKGVEELFPGKAYKLFSSFVAKGYVMCISQHII